MAEDATAKEKGPKKRELTPEERVVLERMRLIEPVESNNLGSINDRVGFIF